MNAISKKYVLPKAGINVPNPETGKPVPQTGCLVVFDSYWRRRSMDGDIQALDQAPAVAQEATTEQPEAVSTANAESATDSTDTSSTSTGKRGAR